MIEEMITQAQAYISQRYLPWSLAAIALVVGMIFIRGVDHHLGRFFSTVDYDRTLEILCQRSVKWFLWVVLISLIAGSLGFNVSGFIAGLSVTGFVVGFAVKDMLANFAAGMFILIKALCGERNRACGRDHWGSDGSQPGRLRPVFQR